MRLTSPGDAGQFEFAEQPWAAVPELDLEPALDQAQTRRYFFGQRRSRSRKTSTDPQVKVSSDVSRLIQQGCYHRLAVEATPTSFEELFALAPRSAVTIVTLRDPLDNDLPIEDVREEWHLSEHWTVAQAMVMTDVEGTSHQVQVEFLGPPGTTPGSSTSWADGGLYAYPYHLFSEPYH